MWWGFSQSLARADCDWKRTSGRKWENSTRTQLEKAVAPHSSTLAWKMLWTEKPGRLQFMGSLRVGHDWATSFTFRFHALEKEMATHSSVLAWRIPATGEPGGLPSMGSHRVGHDWSDLAVAAAGPSSPAHWLGCPYISYLTSVLPFSTTINAENKI